jgi:hypothetical protein
VNNETGNSAGSALGISVPRDWTSLQRRGFVSIAVFLTSVLLLAAGWIVRGDVDKAVRPDSDDFVRAGELIIHWIITGGTGLGAMMADVLYPHYFVPSVIIAGAYMYLGDPVVKIVALNCVLFSLVVVLMYQFWASVHGPWQHWLGRRGFLFAGIGGFYIIFGLPDPFLFSYTVLTDTIFLFWVAVFVVAASRGLLDGRPALWVLALLMALIAPYVRPTGIVLPVLLVYAAVVYVFVRRTINLRWVAVVSIGVPVVFMLFVVPWLVSGKINGSGLVEAVIPDIFRREFNQAVYFFQTGIIVSDRPGTHVAPPTGYMDVMKMIIYRLGYYLVPLRFGDIPYTVTHNAVNLLYVLLTWPLAVIGVRRMAMIDRRCFAVMLFLIMVAMSFALLHSATLLSFGWRYQMPAMVPLWMLAGVGLFVLLGYPVVIRNGSERLAGREVRTA